MWNTIRIWINERYHSVVDSIAFYPVIIGTGFLVFSFLMIIVDFWDPARLIKSQLSDLKLKDADTARSIISAIAAGVISLAVFSFSMVMIVLNQAASQMSNRVLDKLIGNRFQQMVLGIYIGTIVYAFFILSTIRELDSGVYIPALSTYILIFITIFDIFLFIYFLHYITQSVKYDVIIDRIFRDTKRVMESTCKLGLQPTELHTLESDYLIKSFKSGIYENFDKETLIDCGDNYDCVFKVLPTPGTFILKDIPLVKASRELPEEAHEEILKALFIHTIDSIESNFYYGFRQLMEVAIKALSPGINDPGTAVLCLRALFQLFQFRQVNFPENTFKNKEEKVRVVIEPLTFEKMFNETLLPIWDYGKHDRMMKLELYQLLKQLQTTGSNDCIDWLLAEVRKEVNN